MSAFAESAADILPGERLRYDLQPACSSTLNKKGDKLVELVRWRIAQADSQSGAILAEQNPIAACPTVTGTGKGASSGFRGVLYRFVRLMHVMVPCGKLRHSLGIAAEKLQGHFVHIESLQDSPSQLYIG